MKTKKEADRVPAQLFSFIESVLRLKSVKRSGWVSKALISSPESVSDHTYAMCAIGMVLSDMLGLDTERVTKMIIIHDLSESIIGDYMPGEIARKRKRIEERNAMTSILNQMPVAIRSNYRRIWEEYQANKTQVAKFVHKLDKLEMAMQAIQYINEGYPKKSLIKFLNSARRSLIKFNDDHDNHDRRDVILEILNSLEKIIVK
ncbi:MAG: HD domain-containing protein [Nitrososphaeraceae archaeon]